MTFMRFTIYALLTLAALLFYPFARADKLDWTNPTTRGNSRTV